MLIILADRILWVWAHAFLCKALTGSAYLGYWQRWQRQAALAKSAAITKEHNFTSAYSSVTIRHNVGPPLGPLRYASASKIWLEAGFLRELAIAILRKKGHYYCTCIATNLCCGRGHDRSLQNSLWNLWQRHHRKDFATCSEHQDTGHSLKLTTVIKVGIEKKLFFCQGCECVLAKCVGV